MPKSEDSEEKKKSKFQEETEICLSQSKVYRICVFVMSTEVCPLLSEDWFFFSSKGQCLVALTKKKWALNMCPVKCKKKKKRKVIVCSVSRYGQRAPWTCVWSVYFYIRFRHRWRAERGVSVILECDWRCKWLSIFSVWTEKKIDAVYVERKKKFTKCVNFLGTYQIREILGWMFAVIRDSEYSFLFGGGYKGD